MEVHAADTTSFVSRFFSVAGIVGCDDAPGCLIATSSLDTAELRIKSGWATVANSKQCMQWAEPANDGKPQPKAALRVFALRDDH